MSTRRRFGLNLTLRWKIVLTIMLVAVLVVLVGGVQSYYANMMEDRGDFLIKHYNRFDEYRQGLGRAYASTVRFLATDPELERALAAGDGAAAEASFRRAIGSLRRTIDPDLMVLVNAQGEQVPVRGATELSEQETTRSRLVADVRSGSPILGELAVIDGRVYQVSGAAVRQQGQVVGGIIVGHRLENFLHEFREQSDPDRTKQHRLTLVDGRNRVLASVFPEEEWGTLGPATQENNWETRPEGERDVDVINLDGNIFDFTKAPVRGYSGPGYDTIGTMFLMRTRDFKAEEFADRAVESLVPLLAAFIISLIIGLWVAIGITRRINRYVEATEDFAKGGGDLTKRLDASGTDELGLLAENLNAAFRHIHDLAAAVQRAAFQVGASSAEISAASKQMLEGAREQAKKTEGSTAAVTELSASIQQVAENATETTRVARNSGQTVKSAIERMNEIRRTVEEAASRIQDLGESGKRIGNIVEVIRQISDQTTLLALNAAIEAAHAGEQGRGFAVVADEVSGLANRVGQSARDIEELIATIKEQTTDAVRAMEAGTHEVEAGTQLVTNTLADLQTLIQVVEDTAKAVQEQAVASDEIARNMDVVQRIAQDVLSASEEAVDQGEHLHRLAFALEQSVKGFRIDGQTAGAGPAASAPETLALPGGNGRRAAEP
jgi:methyl-accepting chemotaxis protein